MTRSLLILGARSDMARACAHRFAREGFTLMLAARNAQSLEADAQDLRLRHGVEVSLHELDALDTPGIETFLDALPALPDVALSAVGFMGDQPESQANPQAAATVLRSNFEGPALLFGALAERFAARGTGALIGISSVAGDRGRASNYVYGAAKAGFTAFLSGLRNRFDKTTIQVLTVKPGFVATQMTEGMGLNPKLTAQPDEVAEAIWKAHQKGRNVIYVKPIWWVIMTIIRTMPEMIFKKTSM